MSAFFATCPKGLEYLLKDELIALGAGDVREALAGVSFTGTIETAYRACLWSRMASRVLLPLAEFDAADPEALYAGVQGIDWAEHLAAHGTLAVDANTAQSKLTLQPVHRAQDQGRHRRPVSCRQWRAARRGPGGTRRAGERAPAPRPRHAVDRPLRPALAPPRLARAAGRGAAKENLASAMLVRGQWPRIYAEGGALVDPMCGSGTLLIEGALMAADVAPGLRRDYYGFLGWRKHDYTLWRGIYDEAKARAEEGLRALRPVFFGSDSDPHMVQTAKRNAQSAGVAGFIHLDRRDAAHVEPAAGNAAGPGHHQPALR